MEVLGSGVRFRSLGFRGFGYRVFWGVFVVFLWFRSLGGLGTPGKFQKAPIGSMYPNSLCSGTFKAEVTLH